MLLLWRRAHARTSAQIVRLEGFMWGAARQCQAYFCFCCRTEVKWGLRGVKTHANRAPQCAADQVITQVSQQRRAGVAQG